MSDKASESGVLVRSTWHAAKVPGHDSPYDVAHLKVYYPATADSSDDAKQSGEMAADLSAGPLPVVVFASGVNCSQDAYRWLAIELVPVASRWIAVPLALCLAASLHQFVEYGRRWHDPIDWRGEIARCLPAREEYPLTIHFAGRSNDVWHAHIPPGGCQKLRDHALFP